MRSTRLLLTALLLCVTAIPGAYGLPLWEIGGTQNRIRLLGSIHFLRPQDFPLPKTIMDAYREADVLVMELDMSNLDPFEVQKTLQLLSIDSRGRNLETLMGTRAYREAQKLAAEIDVDLGAFRPYEPWFAALQITQLRLMQLGFDGSNGVDSYFTGQAVQDGKQIRGLETLEFQLGTMDSLPPEAQREFLLQTLDDAIEIDETMDDIVGAWKAGNTKKLQSELLEGLDEQPDLYDRILVQRNKDWAASILDLVDDSQDYLIVVGALHLVGKDSVLSLIEDAGYPTRQIK
jgi:uncharacterized protein YbaP (TraB family)